MQVELRGMRAVAEGGAVYQQVQRGVAQNLTPFSAPPSEIAEYEKFEQEIKQRNQYKPSTLAKLSNEAIQSSPTIQMIDQIFITAIEEYEATLAFARDKDLARVLNPPPRDEIIDFRDAIAAEAQNTTRHIPNIIIVRHIAAPFCLFVSAIKGMTSQTSHTRAKINLENSEYRQKWLNETKILEAQRKKLTIQLINQRVAVLSTNIEEHPDLIDTSSTKELKALNQLNECLQQS